MKIIYGTVAGLVTGFVTSVLVAPRSGTDTRQSLNRKFRTPVKDVRMTYNKLAYKLGLISKKKRAQLNKATVEAYNAKMKSHDSQQSHLPGKSIDKVHETAHVTNSTPNVSTKKMVRKVPDIR